MDSNATGNEKRFRFISYMLVFLMMSCVVLTISILIHNLLPSWHPGIYAGILLFIVLDRLYTHRQLKSLTPWMSEWLIAVGAHWIVILFFGRLLLSYANGADALRADLLLFTRGYILDLFTPEFVILLIFAYVAWELASQFLELLDEIGLDMRAALRDDPLRPLNLIPAHQRLVTLIFTIGVALVILTALTRINLRMLVIRASDMPPVELSRFSGGEAGALLYFVFGLALLSLSRLMSLQTHWNRLRIPVSSTNLAGQWAMYSLIFLMLLAVMVSILPSGDSLGFFSVVATLFMFLLQILFFIAQLIITLLLLVVSIPFFLFGTVPPFMTTAGRPRLPTPPTEPLYPTSGVASWELVRSIVLWGGLIVILAFSLIHFIRQHESVLAALRKSRVVNWLLLAWQWLYRSVGRTSDGLARAITDGWQRIMSRLDGKRVLPRPGWINLRRLDPRRKVYFFYLAMVRRAGERGLARNPSQTPSEYAIQLERSVPSAAEDIDSLTQAFVEARYSRKQINSGNAKRVAEVWGRIRRALKDGSRRHR